MGKANWVARIKSFRINDGLPLLLAIFLVASTFCIIGPLELYFGNIDEFWFNISDLIFFIIALFLGTFCILLIIGSLLSQRTRRIYICILFGLGLAMYLQANLLNGNMGLLDGREVNWSASLITLTINSLIWILCILVPIMISLVRPKWWSGVVNIIAILIIAMQMSAVTFLGVTAEKENNEVQLTTEGLFSLSRENNVVIFVVDTLDAQFFENYIMSDENFMNNLSDFTYYDNAVSGGAPTHFGMPMLLTGMYYNGEEFSDYLKEAYSNTDFYDKLRRLQYDARIYTNLEHIDGEFCADYIENAKNVETEITSIGGLLSKLYQFVGYKYFPNGVKNYFYLYSGEFDQFRGVATSDYEVYSVNDANYIAAFRESGLDLVDNAGAFRVYHLFGAHGPHTLKEDGTSDGSETSLSQQIHGVMSAIFDFMDEMKEQGIFDRSTIIITGDHGAVDIYQNPCFLIKASGQTQPELQISHAPITFQNVLPTLSQAIDGKNDEAGETIYEVEESENEPRYQVVTVQLAEQYDSTGRWTRPVLYSVGNPARNTAAIQEIREIWPEREPIKLELGQTISFCSGESGTETLYNGFSTPEASGTWTEDTETYQRFEFVDAPTGNIKVDLQLSNIYGGAQYVTIYFNDYCVYSKRQDSTTISFVIPKEAIREGEQEIRYELSVTIPAENSESTDSRWLSLMFESMVMTQTDESFTEVTPINQYQLGENIEFTEDSDGTRYFTKGISGIETDSAWSLGTSGQLVLHVGDVTGDLVGEFQFKSMYAPPQQLIVSSGGQVLYDQVLTTADEPVTFSIPASCVENGTLVLDLEYPGAVSPASRGESTDGRELAFRFLSIRVDAAQP